VGPGGAARGQTRLRALAGALPFSGSDPVVVSAHLYGVIGGAAAAAFLKPHRTPL